MKAKQGLTSKMVAIIKGGIGMAKTAAKAATPKAKPAAKKAVSKPAVRPAKAVSKPAPKPPKKAASAAKKSAPKPVTKPAAKQKESTPVMKVEGKPEKKQIAKPETPVEVNVVAEKPAKAPKAPKIPKITKKQQAAADAIESANEKWADYKKKHGSEKAQPYSMRSTYEANTPLQHKTFGWGYITSIENDRLEVLFESGAKHLISNYKG